MQLYQIGPNFERKNNFFSSFSLTTKLILINVFCFILFSILNSLNLISLSLISINPNNVLNHGYFWTLLTSMFMHGDIFHLFVNMLSLYFVGSLVEKILGKKRYILLYLLSGIFSGLFFVLTASLFGDLNTFGVGASGALFGIIGVLIFLTPNLPVYLLFIPIPIKMKYAAPGILILIWLISVLGGLPIGNISHLGGLIAGVIYGIYLKYKFPNKMRYVREKFS